MSLLGGTCQHRGIFHTVKVVLAVGLGERASYQLPVMLICLSHKGMAGIGALPYLNPSWLETIRTNSLEASWYLYQGPMFGADWPNTSVL